MYFKDKEHRITIRLTTEQLSFIDKMALGWGVNRSDIFRIIIDSFRGKENENK